MAIKKPRSAWSMVVAVVTRKAIVMEELAAFLALNGAVVLLFSSLVGLALARSLHLGTPAEHWHLLHAGGTSRGIMLLALAASIRFAELPATDLAWASGLVTFFVWTSILAMLVRCLTGMKGFHRGGPAANKIVFYLYASGTVALPIGLVWLAIGFVQALR
ncbi:MAG: hypothetical protein HKP40_03340 [Litoreibacter sp.]|nr:hypothetical protein [Litoreibacter sp.]